MQITNHFRSNPNDRYRKARGKKGEEAESDKLGGLGTSDIIGDIFNNRGNDPDEERRRDVKLRLSKTSQVLTKELKERLKSFFAENKALAKEFENLDLPEVGYSYTSKQGDLFYRKVGVYLLWVQFEASVKEEDRDPEMPPSRIEERFLAIQAYGKDDEMLGIVEGHYEKHEEINDDRSRDVPNYYYLIYPETYSFN